MKLPPLRRRAFTSLRAVKGPSPQRFAPVGRTNPLTALRDNIDHSAAAGFGS